MKKVFAIMMAVLLIGALFISCSQQVQEDRLGSVGIYFQESRNISVDVDSNIKPIGDLIWYYTATKTSGFYATGQTDGLTLVPEDEATGSAEGALTTGSSLGSYSTGLWEFSFYGFDLDEPAEDPSELDTDDAVYYATVSDFEVKVDEINPVDIALSVGKVDNGKVVFTGLSLDCTGKTFVVGGTLTLTISQDPDLTDTSDGTTIVQFDSETVSSSVKVYNLKVKDSSPAAYTYEYKVDNPGTYNYVFSVVYTKENESVEVAKEVLPVTINKGTTVTFSSDVLKTEVKEEVVIGEITGETKAEAEIAATEVSEPVKVIVSVSPASASDADAIAETIVEFAANSIPAANPTDTYTLKTEVTGIEEAASSDSTFVVTGSAGAVAAIDLSLYKNDSETATQLKNNASVTITTYIAKGLTNVVVYYDGNRIDGNFDYDSVTGKLVFETDHFSTFAVGADQNVYDKTTNTAYKISERDDDTKGFLLDAAGNKATANPDDEYVLLDSTKANLVHDDIDVFNAGYSWTVIHASTEHEDTTNFAGGYGTKIEPYLISNSDQFQNVSKLSVFYYIYSSYYGINGYEKKGWEDAWNYGYSVETTVNNAYFKVSDGVDSIDCKNWVSVYLDGHFDGNKVILNNVDNQLFYSVSGDSVLRNFTVNANIVTTSAFAAAVVYRIKDESVSFENVNVHGYLQAGQCASYLAFGSNDSTRIDFSFKNCHSDITLVATSEKTAGFIDHPYCKAGSTLTLVDSYYDGKQSNVEGGYCYYAYQVFNRLTVNDNYSGKSSIVSGNNYIKANSTSQLSKGSLTMPEVGGTFSVDKATGATYAVAILRIGPNDKNETGNYVGTYMTENCVMSENAFSTASVVNFDITINGTATESTGISGNVFNIVSSAYGTTYGSANVSIVQYDANDSIVAINEVSIKR